MPKRSKPKIRNAKHSPAARTAAPAAALALAAFDLDTFCEVHRISRGLLYLLWKEGKGPRFFRAGARRLISAEAAAEWVRAREAEAAKVA
ncbi:MAG TPA: hypothetical protein VMU06_07585 [Stellaceae bacterium]|nr:hypothetical protein [Stellaceae bacterium]